MPKFWCCHRGRSTREIVTPAAEGKLAELGEVDRNLSDKNLPREEVIARVSDVDAILTSWGRR